MADIYTLEAQPRTIIGKHVKKLRKQDLIPAVIYGIDAPIHVSCPRRALEIVLAKAGGTHLIAVSVDGKTHNTLVREVQRHSIRRDILHVDFMRVDLTKTLRTEVQILLVNVPKLGADVQVAQSLLTIEVECLPTAIPEHIEADASKLAKLGDRLTVGDLPKLPSVEYLTEGEEVIARVESLTAQDEEATDTLAPAEPELVEKRKKADEDEEE